jgi:hypothetical protein
MPTYPVLELNGKVVRVDVFKSEPRHHHHEVADVIWPLDRLVSHLRYTFSELDKDFRQI